MNWMRRIARRARALLFHRAAERELDEELRFHLVMEAEQYEQGGASTADAEWAARRAFGGVERFREDCRDVRGVRVLEDAARDVRYAMRSLRRTPGLTLVAVVTIALGIGANTAIMSAVHSLLFAHLPYPDASQLVEVGVTKAHGMLLTSPTLPMLDAWRERGRSIAAMGYLHAETDTLTLDEPELLRGAAIEPTLPRVLGIQPVLGRTFLPQEATIGAPHVVVIGYGLWQSRFDGRADVLGRVLTINSQPYTVIGVMPRGFDLFLGGLYHWQLWMPLVRDPHATRISAVARLRPGVSSAQANRELNAVIDAVGRGDSSSEGMRANIRTLPELVTSSDRRLLLILAGATGFVVLIACANVANLLLSRAAARQRELAIRTAIGAGRSRLVRQLLTEGALLALLGGAAGLGVAWIAVHLIVAFRPPTQLPQLDRVHLDLATLLWGLGLALGTGLLFALIPALLATRRDVGAPLARGSQRVAGSARTRRVSAWLMAGEVALSVILLAGAGLLVRTAWASAHFDPGFDTRNLVTIDAVLPEQRYRTAAERLLVYQALLERVRRLAGVRAASWTVVTPPSGALMIGDLQIDGRAFAPGEDVRVVMANAISPSYLATMGIRLRGGRLPVTDTSAHEAVINQTFARRYWPGASAIGHRIRMKQTGPWSVIVGIVDDVRGVEESAEGLDLTVYHRFYGSRIYATLIIRTAPQMSGLPRRISAAASVIDPSIRLGGAETVESNVDWGAAYRRFVMALLSAFAVLALALAAVGLYGVISYSVTQRTREIGVRMALGARSTRVVRAIVTQALWLTLAGVGVGLAGAAALTRVIRSMLFGVGPLDPVSFVGAAVLLVVVAVVASALPARRAARVDPVVALRVE
ncbi:MAG TPA: ABC transporter permease [Gemmatimonadaceae bacterium]|nr:ABC transporter permease [Gemmatimonadaceae bacterium]